MQSQTLQKLANNKAWTIVLVYSKESSRTCINGTFQPASLAFSTAANRSLSDASTTFSWSSSSYYKMKELSKNLLVKWQGEDDDSYSYELVWIVR